MGNGNDDERGWTRERDDVLRELALQSQTLTSLQKDIVELRTWLAQLVSELKAQAENDRVRLLTVEREQLVCGNATRRRLDILDKEQVPSLNRRVQEIEKLVPALRAITWVGAILGMSIIALIWALITGQAQVVFP